jgi:large subunit ribosomal protein L31
LPQEKARLELWPTNVRRQAIGRCTLVARAAADAGFPSNRGGLRAPADAAIEAPSQERAMKDGIHPDYHEITVVMTDGTTYQTRSTYGKPGDTLRLDIDSKSHPAWTGGQQRLVDSGGQLARFNKRFQGFGLQQK